jgi:hypothetical protein
MKAVAIEVLKGAASVALGVLVAHAIGSAFSARKAAPKAA